MGGGGGGGWTGCRAAGTARARGVVDCDWDADTVGEPSSTPGVSSTVSSSGSEGEGGRGISSARLFPCPPFLSFFPSPPFPAWFFSRHLFPFLRTSSMRSLLSYSAFCGSLSLSVFLFCSFSFTLSLSLSPSLAPFLAMAHIGYSFSSFSTQIEPLAF